MKTIWIPIGARAPQSDGATSYRLQYLEITLDDKYNVQIGDIIWKEIKKTPDGNWHCPDYIK
jgi:hypothetical protein